MIAKRSKPEILPGWSGTVPDNCPTDAVGSGMPVSVAEIGTNRWRVTVNEPFITRYYNVYISGADLDNNIGRIGVEPSDIQEGFFDAGGGISSEAIFFEGDVTLPAPRILVDGENAADDPEIRFENTIPIVIDFTTLSEDDCAGVNLVDEPECFTEDKEYEADSFGEVVVLLFELGGFNRTVS
jgi:hypothetical protein